MSFSECHMVFMGTFLYPDDSYFYLEKYWRLHKQQYTSLLANLFGKEKKVAEYQYLLSFTMGKLTAITESFFFAYFFCYYF